MKSMLFFDLGNLFAERRLGEVQSVGSPTIIKFNSSAKTITARR
jgi:hypothetical protein